MDQSSLALTFGTVETTRPLSTPLRQQRHWWAFDTKESAIRWSLRNAPKDTGVARGLSAHPRALRTSTGEHALVYDGICTRGGHAAKFVLLKDGSLERTR